MARIRAERVAEQMKKEIADIIRNDIRDPRVGFATVTRVEVSNDLQYAKVYVSVLGDEVSKRQTVEALTRALGYVRGEVSRRLRMRLAPEMVIKLDESGEYSAHIEDVLRKLRADAGAAAGDDRAAAAGESAKEE